jgi:hypothetical protein
MIQKLIKHYANWNLYMGEKGKSKPTRKQCQKKRMQYRKEYVEKERE